MQKNEMDRSGVIIIRICIFSIILSLTALALSAIFHKWIYKTENTYISFQNTPTIIIDAGHGGEDGGAVAADGTKEKDLNLAMALNVGDMLSSAGYDVVYTRTDDTMLYTNRTKGSLKIQDLTNRLNVAKKYDNCIFISLHMNKFTQEKYSGVQTFYSTNDDQSVQLASTIQNNVQKLLQNDNNREIKPANSSIFILNRAKTTAVLIECGFLSNTEECEKLKTDTYRKELSSVISESIIEFLQQA